MHSKKRVRKDEKQIFEKESTTTSNKKNIIKEENSSDDETDEDDEQIDESFNDISKIYISKTSKLNAVINQIKEIYRVYETNEQEAEKVSVFSFG